MNIEGEELEVQKIVRNRCLLLLKKFVNNHHITATNNSFNWLAATKNFLKNHPNIIFTRADKGHVIVVLDLLVTLKK